MNLNNNKGAKIYFKMNLSHSYENYDLVQKGIMKWRDVIKNIINCNVLCGACLTTCEPAQSLNTIFLINSKELTFREILQTLFGQYVVNMMANSYICDECTEVIFRAYTFIQNVQTNNKILQQCINIVTEKSYVANNVQKLNIELMLHNIVLECSNIYNNCDRNEFDVGTVTDAVKLDSDFDNNDELALICIKNKLKSLKYECPNCEFVFNDFSQWKSHSSGHTDESYMCKECHKNFKTINVLVEHRRTKHSHNITDCLICKVILQRKMKKRHYRQYHNDQRLICDYCSKEFYDRPSIKRHLRLKHMDRMSLFCDICSKTFTCSFNFEKHRCNYKCNECNIQPCVHDKYLKNFREQQNIGANPMKCADCGYTFKFKHQIIVHANKVHLNLYPHLCDFCGEGFVSKEMLKYHRNKHKEIMLCMHCNKGFKDRKSLDEHIHFCEITDRNYDCDVCNSHFTTQKQLLFHKRKHYPKDFQCKVCPKKYWSKSELNVHLKRIHKDKFYDIDTNVLYQCTMCSMDFKSKKDLQSHISTHDKDSSHVCRFCGAAFKSKINYYNHVRRHKIKKDKECPVCLKLYDKYNIENHIKSHDSMPKESTTKLIKKNTMCEICGRLLINEKSLIKHREIHREQQQCPRCLKFINTVVFEKHLQKHIVQSEPCSKANKKRRQYNCSKCDYSTLFNECLEGHMNRYHLQIRPFQCDICKKGFYAKLTLKEHIKIHSGLKPEQCHECGNRFVNKKALKMHVRIHSGEKPYPCDLCEERFLSASRRQAHRIRKHFDPTVRCEVCLKMFYTRSAVRLHIRDCHSNEPRERKRKKVTG